MSRHILKQSSKISFWGLVSRAIAFIREIFLIRFFSVGDNSDIFFTAIRIPNTLRKIFAEGSLSSVLVPGFVSAEHRGGISGLNRLVSVSFLIIELFMLACCWALFYWAQAVIQFIVPGFDQAKIQASVHLLRILISFILFISSGSIFAAALQSQKKFLIPALAPSILNVCYVLSLIACLYFKLSVDAFCYFWIVTAVVFFVLHLIAYVLAGYGFAWADEQSMKEFKRILIQFLPCFISVGIGEINHFINTAFCSYLPSGSMTLSRYAYQFVNIPVGLIAAPLFTVLLPHFAKLHLEKPEDVAEQLFEAMKFVIWVTIPISILMAVFSGQFFQTLFAGDACALEKVAMAQSIFKACLVGLLFFSVNKIFSCIFYALRLTIVPFIASCVSIGVNVGLNQLLINDYGAAGIVFSSSVAAMVQSFIFIIVLSLKLKIGWSLKAWIKFLGRYCDQLLFCFGLFYGLYMSARMLVIWLDNPFLNSVFGFWFWISPVVLILFGMLYCTRKWFGIELSYLD